MDNGITHASHRKIYLHLLTWLRARPIWLGERVFAATDSAARQQDWQIISAHAGRGRKHRDHRFDSLAACSPCRGRGAEDAGDLRHACTGRVILTAQAADPPPRRSA